MRNAQARHRFSLPAGRQATNPQLRRREHESGHTLKHNWSFVGEEIDNTAVHKMAMFSSLVAPRDARHISVIIKDT
jgi:hypothetical protein